MSGFPPRSAPSYADEYRSACAWSTKHDLRAPTPRWRRPVDCVDWQRAGPVLEELLAAYSDQDVANQAAEINHFLLPTLSEACGVRFTLTLGWIETSDERFCQHGPDLPAKLLEEGIANGFAGRLPMHVWLTSPACEIIDVALPVRLHTRPRDPNQPRPVFYFSCDDTAARVIYHPTVVGDDFLRRIGVSFSDPRHRI